MSSFGERIELALSRRGKTKIWLAEQIGLSKQALNYIIYHSTKPKYASEIALALNIDCEWLGTGEGEIEFFDQLGVGKKIPLFTSNNIVGQFTELTNIQSENFITVDFLETDDTFAFQLDNKSMEPLFNIGTILLFRENKLPIDGDYVLCILEKNNEIVFRQYLKDGSGIYLKPFNDTYGNILNEKYRIIGTLIESRFRYSK